MEIYKIAKNMQFILIPLKMVRRLPATSLGKPQPVERRLLLRDNPKLGCSTGFEPAPTPSQGAMLDRYTTSNI